MKKQVSQTSEIRADELKVLGTKDFRQKNPSAYAVKDTGGRLQLTKWADWATQSDIWCICHGFVLASHSFKKYILSGRAYGEIRKCSSL